MENVEELNTRDDLGFSFVLHKSGKLDILHHANVVTHFNTQKGKKVAVQLQGRSFKEQQVLMARLTGNYKRGNERH